MSEKNAEGNKKLDYDAKTYCAYRQDTPEEIISKIMHCLKEKYKGSLNIAVDVGCGSGQSTVVLAPFFKEVYGLDGIEKQIKEAENSRVLNNVVYRTGPAETLPFDDSSVQLITAATSLHWFDLNRFFPEARRVLSNNGILAVYGYLSLKPLLNTPALREEIDKLYDEYYEALDPYFLPQVKIIIQKYRTIQFPFEEVIRETDIRCKFQGCLSDVVGYITTYSSLKSCRDQDPAKADEIVRKFEKRLYEITAAENISSNETVTLYRDYMLITCRKVV